MIDLDTIEKILERAPIHDLSRIIGQASYYNTVIRRVALLHAAFLETSNDAILMKAVRDAATIYEYIPYTEANAYCQVIDELRILIQRLAESGRAELAQRLAAVAIEAGDASGEKIMDGDYWQMSVDDLRKMAASLSSYTMG